MKITFVYGSLSVGGAERVIAYLANRFAELGNDVSVLIFTRSKPVYEVNSEVNVITPDSEFEVNGRISRIKNLFLRMNYIRKNVKKSDCVFAFDPYLALFTKLSCMRTRVIGAERMNPKYRMTRNEKLAIKKSHWLNGYVFQTDGAKLCYPVKTQIKSVVIPNGVFATMPEQMPKYCEREKVICASGRLQTEKRYDLLIDAFSMIAEKYTEYRLRIYGVGTLEKELKKRAEQSGFSKRIDFMGWTNAIGNELRKNRVFVLTSDNEGMPNGLLEAMACGCACISTDCDFGPREIISQGIDGMLVPTGNAKAIADAMEIIIEDENRATKMAEAASEKIASEFKPERIANMFLDYAKIIAK